jgi:hypothetical protein
VGDSEGGLQKLSISSLRELRWGSRGGGGSFAGDLEGYGGSG